MGKFYVYIHREEKKYKVNRDDVKEVYSHTKAIKPPLPNYHRSAKASRSPLTEANSSDQESAPL
jgi:hypothetical protein